MRESKQNERRAEREAVFYSEKIRMVEVEWGLASRILCGDRERWNEETMKERSERKYRRSEHRTLTCTLHTCIGFVRSLERDKHKICVCVWVEQQQQPHPAGSKVHHEHI